VSNTEEYTQVKVTHIAKMIESHTFYSLLTAVVIALLLWENNSLLRKTINVNHT